VASLKVISLFATDVTIALYTYICHLTDTLVHPAKAVEWNEMPFGRNACVVQNNTASDRGTAPHGKGRFGV